jgi:hypothetical protein
MYLRIMFLSLVILLSGCYKRPIRIEENTKTLEEIHRLRRELEQRETRIRDLEIKTRKLETEKNSSTRSSDTRSGNYYRQPFNTDEEMKEFKERQTQYNRSNKVPPLVLHLWVVINSGKVYQHGLKPDNYDGTVRKLGHIKTTNGYVITFVSEKDPDIVWRALLPREDGEHYIDAYLVR